MPRMSNITFSISSMMIGFSEVVSRNRVRLSGTRAEYIAEETVGYVAEGFTAVKIKIGFDPQEGIEVDKDAIAEYAIDPA